MWSRQYHIILALSYSAKFVHATPRPEYLADHDGVVAIGNDTI